MTKSGTTGKGQNNSSHLSVPMPWLETMSCTSYIPRTSYRVRKKLTRRRKLWQTVENKGKFEMLEVACSKFCKPFEHLAVYEMIVLFERNVACKQYMPKKHKPFGIKIYNLWHDWLHTGYGHIVGEREKKWSTKDMKAIAATVKQLRRVKGCGPKLCYIYRCFRRNIKYFRRW